MAEEAKTEVEQKDNDALRNAIFIIISLLIIVFLIALALLINRGLGSNNTPTPEDNSLINSDTNIPADSSSDSEDNSDQSDSNQDSNSEENNDTEETPAPEPVPAPQSSEEDGSVGEAASTEAPSDVLPTGHTEVGYKRSLSTQTEISDRNYWIPTNYVAGDIPSNNGKYTVQYGDTLWWIAAGHYGDAFQWNKIESANFSDIGYLPNGEHALIFPNQVLTLP